MNRAIIIFTRVPAPGQTKTRMMPVLGPEECARLHTCFLEDIKRECGNVKWELFICFTPDDGKELLYPVFGRDEHYIPQRGNGLGERMYQAVREVLGRGYDSCILMGTDVPEVKAAYLERAFDLLKYHDVVGGHEETPAGGV